MWKKLLAILSIPIWLLIAFAAISATLTTIAAGAGKQAGYLVGYYIGMGLCMALFCWMLFFWGRWIWRALSRKRKPQELEWPE